MIPDYNDIRRDAACERGMVALQACASVSEEGASWAAYDWLQGNQAGLPMVAMIEESARAYAAMWAETASPVELECYSVAALDRLKGGPFTSRQIKRLIASMWRRMTPDEQTDFLEWTAK